MLRWIPALLLLAATSRADDIDVAIEAIQQGEYEKALKILKPLAEKGDAQAQYNLGQCYFSGWGVAKDWEQAEKWLRKAAAQDHEWAKVLLGYTVDGLGKHEEAAKIYAWAAEKGVAAAQVRLGQMYAKGLGVEQNMREAVRLYELAAKQGEAAGQAELAQILANGNAVVAKDVARARELAQASAKQGNAKGQVLLGIMLSEGWGGAPDAKQAVKWWLRAAAQDEDTAMTMLGWAYQNGRGVGADPAEAFKWYLLAAKAGNATAQAQVGQTLLDEKLHKGRLAEGVQWLAKAAEQGHVEATMLLGYAYRYARGVARDDDRAAALWVRAARTGETNSMYFLGLLYQDASWSKADAVQALVWLKLAGKRGHADAAAAATKQAAALTPEQVAEADARIARMER
jgi:TPR repeat protein